MNSLLSLLVAAGLTFSCGRAAGATDDAAVFGGADWICPTPLAQATNVTVEVRSPFVAARPGRAELAVSADAVYAVRLNGRTVVTTARLPDIPPRRFYDVWTLEGLVAGTNELAFSVYYPGIDNSRFRAGAPGLRFALSGAGCAASSSDAADWRFSASDRADGVPLVSSQLGFSFEHDAAAKPAAWRAVSADDRTRPPAAASWVRRPVAPPEVLPFVGARLTAYGTLDGSPVPTDAAAGMDATPMRPASDGGLDVRAGLWYLLDLGREEAGLLEIEVDAEAGTVVDIGYAEHAENGRIRTFINGRHFAGRYRARDGRQTFCHWQYRVAGRYLQLHVRGARTRFALIRAGLRPVLRTDVTERPVPDGLDAREQAIWQTAVRTLRLSMHEHYEDCPWREQALYANDARNQMLAGRFAFEDDGAFAAHSLDLLGAGTDANDGWLELCMPARVPITIPSFTFAWTLAVADHFRLYRDRAFAARMLPKVRDILARRLAERRAGLLPRPSGARYWQFYDWAPGLDGHQAEVTDSSNGPTFDAPLNLFFLQALEADATLAAELGDRTTAEVWRTAAAELRRNVRERFWNAAHGCLDTFAGTTDGAAVHELTQALALLADAVPPSARGTLAEKLSEPSDWIETTLSQSLHKYEALVRMGPPFRAKAIRHMNATWGRMLDAGATSFWEMKEGWRAFDAAGSLCHGWSAIPIYIYSLP